MAKYSGRKFILQVEDETTAGTYNTIAALRSQSMTINNESVDITTKGSENASGKVSRELLERGGIQSMSLPGDGVFDDTEAVKRIQTLALNNTHGSFNITEDFTGGLNYSGSFMIASFEEAGAYNDAMTFSLTLESAGEVEFS